MHPVTDICAISSNSVTPNERGNPNTYFSGRSVDTESTAIGTVAAMQPTKLDIPKIVLTDINGREVKPEFTAFPSIESSSCQEYIDHIFAFDPALAKSRFVVSEKLDGANMTVMITPNNIRYFSRNREISAEKPFFDAPMILKKYKKDFLAVQSGLDIMGCQFITLRGEYYGKGINQRIDYGQSQYYAPFAIEKDGQTQTNQQFRTFMKRMNFSQLQPVPILADNVTFAQAIAFNPEKVLTKAHAPQPATAMHDEKPIARYDFIEGVVIQPANRLIKDSNNLFLLKKRAEGFLEIEKTHTKHTSKKGKSKRPPDASHRSSNDLNASSFNRLIDYINANRLINVVSQLGDPTSHKQIGSYVNAVLQDAKKDYCKHHPDTELEDQIPTEAFKPAHAKILELIREKYPELFCRKQKAI